MCKLFMITNTNELTRTDLEKVLEHASKVITPTDRDGFGWAVQGVSGNIFGERYVGNKGIDFPLLSDLAIPMEYRQLFEDTECEVFGAPEEKMTGALLVHARASTNFVCVENSHPHRTEKFTLIHNGVVENAGKKYDMKSTCDTEHLVHYLSTKGVKGMVDNVTGWYAVGALEHATGHFHLIKDSSTGLYSTFVKQINAMCLGTSEFQLESMMKALKWDYRQIMRVKGEMAYEFDRAGKLVGSQIIQPKTGYYKTKSEWKAGQKWSRDDYVGSRTMDYGRNDQPAGKSVASQIGSGGTSTTATATDSGKGESDNTTIVAADGKTPLSDVGGAAGAKGKGLNGRARLLKDSLKLPVTSDKRDLVLAQNNAKTCTTCKVSGKIPTSMTQADASSSINEERQTYLSDQKIPRELLTCQGVDGNSCFNDAICTRDCIERNLQDFAEGKISPQEVQLLWEREEERQARREESVPEGKRMARDEQFPVVEAMDFDADKHIVWTDHQADAWLCEAMDDLYRIMNVKGERIAYSEFQELMSEEQLKCTVFNARGFKLEVSDFLG